MADFTTTPALLTKTQVLAATAISATAVETAAVATGAGVNSGAQGFETARAQGVEFFIAPTIGSTALDQMTVAVQMSDNGTDWHNDDAQSLVLSEMANVVAVGSIRHFVKVGSRANKFVRLAITTSTSQTTDSEVTVMARVAGISQIFTKSV